MRSTSSSLVERNRSSCGVQRVAAQPAGDDRHLLHGLRLADEVRHGRVPGLVVGDDPLLLLGHRLALLEARDDPLERIVEVLVPDLALPGVPRRWPPRCRLARSAPVSPAVWRARRRGRRRRRAASRACGRGGSPRGRRGRARRRGSAGRSARAEERRVEILEPVRGGDDDDLLAVVEAVELDEELVQRLVVLAVEARAARRMPTASSSSMKTIAGACLRARRRACGCAPRRARRTSRRTRRRSASRRSSRRRGRRPWRAASRCRGARRAGSPWARARSFEKRRLEEVDDLLQLGRGVVDAGDVVPGDGRLRRGLDLGRPHRASARATSRSGRRSARGRSGAAT